MADEEVGAAVVVEVAREGHPREALVVGQRRERRERPVALLNEHARAVRGGGRDAAVAGDQIEAPVEVDVRSVERDGDAFGGQRDAARSFGR